MLIRHDPDEWEGVSSRTICPFHQSNPGKPFAGCTCSVMSGSVRRPPKEVAAIKAERQRRKEDDILAQAEGIKRRRAMRPT